MSKSMTIIMRQVAGVIIYLCASVYLMGILFRNPDMTRTRLLMTYWKEYAVCSVMLAIGYVMAKE